MKRIRNLFASMVVASMTLVCNDQVAFAAPKTMPDGGTFDADFYAATYPDVAAAYGNNEAMLYQHYLLCGKAEGRLPYAQGGGAAAAVGNNVKTMPDGGKFDPTFYAASYPDVVAVLGTNEKVLYQHYLTSGKNEGRLPYAPGAVKAAPKNLLECLDVERHGFKYSTDRKDTYGNRYFDKHLICHGAGNYSKYVVFTEVSGYRYLSGTLAPDVDIDKNVTFKINIYAGNTLVYTSPLIEKYTAPVNFDVAINNPALVKIEAISNTTWGSYDYIIIANTTLHD